MKKVIKKRVGGEIEIEVESCGEDKIYAMFSVGDIYKLHKIDGWMFCSLQSSKGGANGRYDSMQALFNDTVGYYTIYQFETQEEFIKWCVTKLYYPPQ